MGLQDKLATRRLTGPPSLPRAKQGGQGGGASLWEVASPASHFGFQPMRIHFDSAADSDWLCVCERATALILVPLLPSLVPFILFHSLSYYMY